MAEYIYASMTDSEALFVGPDDVINVTAGSANQTTVIFGDLNYTVTIAGKTLTFGHYFHDLVDAPAHTKLLFADNSVLYIGDTANNSVNLTALETHDGGAYGGDGSDSLSATGGDWLIQGNQGDDTITGANGHDTVYGGQGNDVIYAYGAFPNFAQGNKGNDALIGGSSADTLLGGQGNDTIEGHGGGDFINGNLGNDSLAGDGQLLGEDGNDTLVGYASGNLTTVTMRGGAGEDSIVAEGGFASGSFNIIFGDDGNDVIVSRSVATDELYGGAGNDTISVAGTLTLVDGGDRLDGGDGADSLVGSSGVDTLSGGAGADTLSSGIDSDALFGGSGADVFMINDRLAGARLDQHDKIYDWEVNDRIAFPSPVRGGYAETTAATYEESVAKARDMLLDPSMSVVSVQVGADVWVFNAGSDRAFDAGVMLVGRTLNDISQDNFV